LVSIELFISDDVSSDKTLQIVSRYSYTYSNIHVISSSKKFSSAAKNFFNLIANVNLSGFDYVAFSDQDDYWFDDKLIFAIKSLNESGALAFSSDVISFWPNTGRQCIIVKSNPQTRVDYWFESPGPGCSQVFHISAFEEFQRFVIENYIQINDIDYHDWFIYAYYRYQKIPWLISSTPKMYYIQHADNQIGANIGLYAAWSRLVRLKTKWMRTQINLIHKIISVDDGDLVTKQFMFKNILRLRRKRSHSLILFMFFVLGGM
jgi:rhamnosyltransferase